MSVDNILDRFAEDYEGLHPVEYALPIIPGSAKAKAIEKAIGGVSKKVLSNAKRSEGYFRKAMKNKGFTENDVDIIRNDIQNLMGEHYDSEDGYNLAISENALNKIMESDGEFKNQFQVGNSGGLVDPRLRAAQSRRNFGTRYSDNKLEFDEDDSENSGSVIKFSRVPKSLLKSEKYGFSRIYSNMPNQYGNFRIDFLPENVKDRTTLTTHDSLGQNMYPVLLKNPETWGGLLGDRDATYFGAERWEDSYNPYKAASKIIANGYDPNTGYRELQYHGPLGLDDVERIQVPARFKIPDQWKIQAEINHFDIIDEKGNVLYKWGSMYK